MIILLFVVWLPGLEQILAYGEVHLVLMNGTPVAKLATVATIGKRGAQFHRTHALCLQTPAHR